MKKQSQFIPPDFLVIPYQVLVNRDLRPTDRILYGAIYWLEHLKDGKCIASNNYLSNMLYVTPGTIANGLTRLEEAGYIRRIFDENNPEKRLQIVCLVAYKAVPMGVHQTMNPKPKKAKTKGSKKGGSSNDEGGFIKQLGGVSSNDEQKNKSPKEEKINIYIATRKRAHRELIEYFKVNTERIRGISPAFSGKSGQRLKAVLEFNNPEQDVSKLEKRQEDLEKLILYYLASYEYREFAPDLTTFCSNGILNGLKNKMQNGEEFWKQLDRFAGQYLEVKYEERDVRDMIARLTGSLSMNNRKSPLTVGSASP